MTSKRIRAEVDRVDGKEIVLDLGGREIRWPRSALPPSLVVGDVLVFDISIDHSAAARDEVAETIESGARRVGSATKRGGRNPRGISTRAAGKK